MTDHDPTKRIPKSLGTDATLLGTYTLSDIAVGLFPSVLVVLVLQVVLPPSLAVGGYRLQALTLPLALLAFGVGALFVYLTPTYTTSIDWVATFLAYHRSPTRIAHEAAREYTQIERVHPDRGVLERTDGAFLGVIQVDPPTMALATPAEWASTAAAFQDVLNTAVEFPIQIYSTTQRFPTETYLARYQDRLDDPDVGANPHLERLIEEYIAWYGTELDDRRMTIRDHYVIVPVTLAEIQFDRGSLIQQLARIPILGVFLRVWFAPPRAEQDAALFDALETRLQRIETGIRGIDGCNAHRVDATEAAELVAEFWAGQPRDYADTRAALRTRPLVGPSREGRA